MRCSDSRQPSRLQSALARFGIGCGELVYEIIAA
jgi:hypothetical protein